MNYLVLRPSYCPRLSPRDIAIKSYLCTQFRSNSLSRLSILQPDMKLNKNSLFSLQVLSKFDRVVSEQMQAERIEFKKQLAEMAGKMSAIEQTLKRKFLTVFTTIL